MVLHRRSNRASLHGEWPCKVESMVWMLADASAHAGDTERGRWGGEQSLPGGRGSWAEQGAQPGGREARRSSPAWTGVDPTRSASPSALLWALSASSSAPFRPRCRDKAHGVRSAWRAFCEWWWSPHGLCGRRAYGSEWCMGQGERLSGADVRLLPPTGHGARGPLTTERVPGSLGPCPGWTWVGSVLGHFTCHQGAYLKQTPGPRPRAADSAGGGICVLNTRRGVLTGSQLGNPQTTDFQGTSRLR